MTSGSPRGSRFLFAACVACLGLTAAATAQWSDDAAVNEALAPAGPSGDQVQAKLVRTPDGGSWVSYFSSTGGYDVYIQRLEADGTPAFPGGVLVADRSFSSTQDYGMDMDSTGAAVLAYRAGSSSSPGVWANRVLADGTLAWGAGVQLSTGSPQIASPCVAATSDGGVVVAWTAFPSNAIVELRKLDLNGTVVASHTMTRAAGISVTSIVASDAPGATGECVLMTVGFGGFTSPRPLRVQKFDASLTPMWQADDVPVFTAGSVQIGARPAIRPDGDGGCISAWYSSSPSLRVFAQQIRADGTARLSTSQYAVTSTAENQVNPAAAIDPDTGDLYCFWSTLNSSQSQFALKAQRFTGTTRAWGTGGLTLLPLGGTQIIAVGCQARSGGGVTGFWVFDTLPSPQMLYAVGLDEAGTPTWSGSAGGVTGGVAVSTASSQKSRVATAMRPDGEIVAVWSDDRGGTDRMYGQNIQTDGTLGTIALVGDLNGDGAVNSADLGLLIAAWGKCGKGACPADLNGDGVVNSADLGLLIANWS